MKKPLTRFAFALAAVATLVLAACQRDGMMMNHDQMMERMQNDPEMMKQMMDRMMRDPKMAQQMAQAMTESPEQCARMAEHMAQDPEACRNMMQAMATRMDPAAAQQMMQHCGAMMQRPADGAAATPAAPAPPEGAVQEFTVDVSGEGFSPASLAVKKGQPVRIHFRRDDQPTCADEVVFAGLNVRKKLPANQTTTVEITPQAEGELTFACGMDMLKGKLVVS